MNNKDVILGSSAFVQKIALGTVQFGMKYGISNKLGQTKNSEVKKILECAYRNGISMLDTAPSYGDSETVIGNYLDKKSWNVVTKTPNFKGNTVNSNHVNKLLNSFILARKQFNQERLYGLLVHNCDELFLPGGEKIFHAMSQLKKNGIVEKIGVSIYNSEQINSVLDNYPIDLIQLPINILDQRLINDGSLVKLKQNGVEIHARSAFLQGLLLMETHSVPLWFDPIKKKLKSFHDEANNRNISALQLALGFVNSISEIDKVIVGVNTLRHLQEIVDATSIYVNPSKFASLSVNDSMFINPSNWKV
jgi:aryl-alcohol dehydrogenase-like predicted oxidoreductase